MTLAMPTWANDNFGMVEMPACAAGPGAYMALASGTPKYEVAQLEAFGADGLWLIFSASLQFAHSIGTQVEVFTFDPTSDVVTEMAVAAGEDVQAATTFVNVVAAVLDTEIEQAIASPMSAPGTSAPTSAGDSSAPSDAVIAATDRLNTASTFADLVLNVVNASVTPPAAPGAPTAPAVDDELGAGVAAAASEMLGLLQNVRSVLDAEDTTSREVDLERELSGAVTAQDLADDLVELGGLAADDTSMGSSLAEMLQSLVVATQAWAVAPGSATRRQPRYAPQLNHVVRPAIQAANSLVARLEATATSATELHAAGSVAESVDVDLAAALADAKGLLAELREFEAAMVHVSADGSSEIDALKAMRAAYEQLAADLSTASTIAASGSGDAASDGRADDTDVDADEVGRVVADAVKMVVKSSADAVTEGDSVSVSTPNVDITVSANEADSYVDDDAIPPDILELSEQLPGTSFSVGGASNAVPYLCFPSRRAVACVPQTVLGSGATQDIVQASVVMFTVAAVAGKMAVLPREVIQAGRRELSVPAESEAAAARRRLESERAELRAVSKASFATPVFDLALSLRNQPGVTINLDSIAPAAFVVLPRLNSSERAALLNYAGGLREYRCRSDADCTGLEWDPVAGGQCTDERCVCPIPRSGSACQRELSCRWFDSDDSTWRPEGCMLHPGQSNADEVGCVCSRLTDSVAALHELKLKPRCSSGNSLINCAVPTVNLSDLSKIQWNGELTVLLAAVIAVNAAWLVLLLASKLLGNENTVRRRNQYYQFWRKAHAHRLTKTWWRRTWMQMKTQHKLLRVLWFRFNVAQDPAALHTGAQKATVLAAIILLKMLLATLFFRPNNNYDDVCVYDCQFADDLIPGTYTDHECKDMGGEPQYGSGKSTSELVADLVYKSLICAVCATPATIFLDQAFWRTQRVTNAHLSRQGKPTAEQRLVVSAVVSFLVDINDLKSAWYEWVQALALMRVEAVRTKLTNSRLLRLAANQELLTKMADALPDREADDEKTGRRSTSGFLGRFSSRATSSRFSMRSRRADSQVHPERESSRLSVSGEPLGASSAQLQLSFELLSALQQSLTTWREAAAALPGAASAARDGLVPELLPEGVTTPRRRPGTSPTIGTSPTTGRPLGAGGRESPAFALKPGRPAPVHGMGADQFEEASLYGMAAVNAGDVSRPTERPEPPTSFCCPISSELMVDPVTCADGHSYDRAHIERWLSSHNTSPSTNTELPHKDLVPNHALRNAIEDWSAQMDKYMAQARDADGADDTGAAGRRGCCATLWHSVTFWRVFPWLVALLLIAGSDLLILTFGTAVFDDCPQAIATWDLPPRGWAWTVLLSLLQTWFLIDPIFILLRNNVSCTKGRVRTTKYQVGEKAAAGLASVLANVAG